MLKLIDYIRLRNKGLSIKDSWKCSTSFTKIDKLAIILWAVFLVYSFVVFVVQINKALIQENKVALVKVVSQLSATQTNLDNLEGWVVKLLNGQPIKVVDSYYVFSNRKDESID